MYVINAKEKNITPLDTVTFKDSGYFERYDIQEWIEGQPDCLGEKLLMIGKEFSGFDKTNDRLDLLAIDKQGNLVIIENKRDTSGKDVVGQAIKYAAYCSTMTLDDVSKTAFQSGRYSTVEIARNEIKAFIDNGSEEDILDVLNADQRIIIVSREYTEEAKSAAVWVLNKGIDIKLIEMSLYLYGKEEPKIEFISFNTILPSPDLSEQMIRLRNEVRKSEAKTDKEALYVSLWTEIREQLIKSGVDSFTLQTISNRSYFNGPDIKTGLSLNMGLNAKDARVEVRIALNKTGETQRVYEALKEQKVQIESELGQELSWEPEETGQACRIALRWPIDLADTTGHEQIVNYMVCQMKDFHAVMYRRVVDASKG